ncbi:hypothetical protein [Terasakiella pusilla]|uniref:hypothetical protein n=1 Tax=Terasakiella pusilla TaxID=64973 RepID=UPI003AA92744
MTVDPQITAVVDRISDVFYKMTPGEKIEYQDRLNGLDPKALNKAVDELADSMDRRPSIHQVKLAYDKHRPETIRLSKEKPASPIDKAQALVRQYGERIRSCPAINDIPTMAGKAMFRQHLMAVAFIQCQGATGGMGAGIAYSAIDACGYGTWGDDKQCIRMVRDWFDRGKQQRRPDGSYSAACLSYAKTVPEFENVNSVRDAVAKVKKGVKRMPHDNFDKEQQFG